MLKTNEAYLQRYAYVFNHFFVSDEIMVFIYKNKVPIYKLFRTLNKQIKIVCCTGL